MHSLDGVIRAAWSVFEEVRALAQYCNTLKDQNGDVQMTTATRRSCRRQMVCQCEVTCWFEGLQLVIADQGPVMILDVLRSMVLKL
jgi:hypothetical protein